MIHQDPPLRFYQRLGRLIRVSSKEKIKYLVVTLTPKTIEYNDLEKALWNLYSENIDISYILINIKNKLSSSRIIDFIKNMSKIYDDIAIPYTLITQGREISDPITFIIEKIIKHNEKIREEIFKNTEWYRGSIKDEEQLYNIFFKVMTSMIFDGRSAIFKRLEKLLCRSRFYRELNKAIMKKHIFYIYDVDKVSELIYRELKDMYMSQYYDNMFFRLDRKSFARLFINLFEYKNIDKIMKKLKGSIKKYKQIILNIAKIYVKIESYNSHSKYLPIHLHLYINYPEFKPMHLLCQINYFDLTEKMIKDKKILELIKLNLQTIGYKAALNFIRTYM